MADGDLASSHVRADGGALLYGRDPRSGHYGDGLLARFTRTYWRAELTATFSSSSTWGGHSYWDFTGSGAVAWLFRQMMGADGDNGYSFRFPLADGMEEWIACEGEGPPPLNRMGTYIPSFERTDDRGLSFWIVGNHPDPPQIPVGQNAVTLSGFSQNGAEASFTLRDSYRHTHYDVPTTDRTVDGYLRGGVFYLDMYAPGDYGDPVEHPDASTEYQDFTDEGSRALVYYWADGAYRDGSYFARTDDFECECSCRIVLERLPHHPLCPH